MFIKLTDYYSDKPFIIRPKRIDGIRQYEENCEIWCNHFCVLVKETQEEIMDLLDKYDGISFCYEDGKIKIHYWGDSKRQYEVGMNKEINDIEIIKEE